MNTLVAKIQLSISLSMPSPIFLIALSIYLVKSNLRCKPNYSVLITMFRAILFYLFKLVLFLISLNGPTKFFVFASTTFASSPLWASIAASCKTLFFWTDFKTPLQKDSSRKVRALLQINLGAAYKRTTFILLHLNLKHETYKTENILLTTKNTRKH